MELSKLRVTEHYQLQLTLSQIGSCEYIDSLDFVNH